MWFKTRMKDFLVVAVMVLYFISKRLCPKLFDCCFQQRITSCVQTIHKEALPDIQLVKICVTSVRAETEIIDLISLQVITDQVKKKRS